jgi:hypothetical protein
MTRGEEKIITGAVTKEYEEGWERIFGQREKDSAFKRAVRAEIEGMRGEYIEDSLTEGGKSLAQ